VHNLHGSERRAHWKNAVIRRIEQQYLASVDGYIFNSHATQASVTALAPAGRPYVVAPPGGDRLGVWTLEQIEKRAHAVGPLRLLFLANVTALKGLEVVLEALELVPRGTCALEVVGSLEVEPRYARAMQRRASRLSPPPIFHGVLDGPPLVDVLTRAQVMVVPSYYEGFGIAYLEGMAFGMPAIGTRVGAVPELILHGINGYLIPPGDGHALAGHLGALALDRNLLARIGLSALETFHLKPTWEQSAEAVRRFLIGILAGRGSESAKQFGDQASA
jgi:glycosyltransferase involved in cell wall biosynthesis